MTTTAPPTLAIRRLGLGSELTDYRQGWQLQREVHAAVVAGDAPPTALLLEHAEVFTAGRRTEPADLPTDGSEVIEVDRGGRITWHGPGQLVCYPIVPLPDQFDVVAHVRRLEEIAIRTCTDFGVNTDRIAGRSGVWVTDEASAGLPAEPARKIAAIGVRVARGVTMHGIAINVDCDLTWANRIVACGIADAGVTSLVAERSRNGAPPLPPRLCLTTVADRFEIHLREVLAPTLPTDPA